MRIALLISFLVSFLGCTNSETFVSPNVLFIAVDDLRPELNCFGAKHIKSPRIDNLAEEGMMFTRAYCNIPVCGASRASLMTGIKPTRSRFVNYHTRTEVDLPGALTMPAYFKKNIFYYRIVISKNLKY